MKKGLIQTVGLTDGPIVASLRAHKPDFVVFLASERSLPYVEKALAQVPVPGHKALRIGNPEDMNEVFAAGRKAYRLLKEAGVGAFLADPTGGTKTMAAGLTLALAGLGFTFVYVGGNKRDEVGRVISGHEEIRRLDDPTERFHVFEQRAFMQAWNGWRMQSAAQIVGRILKDADEMAESERAYFNALLHITRGMYEWDRFRHAKAAKLLRNNLPTALKIAREWGHAQKIRVLEDLEARLETLAAINLAVNSAKPTFAVLEDLLANAERRADAGRYDDALARLYRALELALEAYFNERHGLKLKQYESWPKDLKRVVATSTKRMGLFELIDAGQRLAEHFSEEAALPCQLYRRKERLRRLVEDRHRSILAHGVQPVDDEDYRSMFDFLAELGLRPARPWPRWGEA